MTTPTQVDSEKHLFTGPMELPAGHAFDALADCLNRSLPLLDQLETERRRAWRTYYGDKTEENLEEARTISDSIVMDYLDPLARQVGELTPNLPKGDPAKLFPHLSVSTPMDAPSHNERMIRWLLERKKGIGGSDVLAALDMDKGKPWSRSQQDLIQEKNTFTLTDKEWEQVVQGNSGATLWGSNWEPAIAHMYMNVSGFTVYEVKETLHSDRHPWQTVNVDGVIETDTGTIGILEVKTSQRGWRNGEIPKGYRAQVMNYLDATGCPFADIICMTGTSRIDVYRIVRGSSINGVPWDECVSILDGAWNTVLKNFKNQYDEPRDKVIEDAVQAVLKDARNCKK